MMMTLNEMIAVASLANFLLYGVVSVVIDMYRCFVNDPTRGEVKMQVVSVRGLSYILATWGFVSLANLSVWASELPMPLFGEGGGAGQ